MSESGHLRKIFSLPVIVAALGYFVDIYDLVLFSIVRVPSLKALGLEGQELIDQGVFLLNMQMAGMLVGGILWGVLGDRKGRLKITDFGLAKMLEEVRKSTTVVGGTPYYVAPEQSRGEDVDARADLYSVGVTLFELCTGSVPFREGDVLQHHRETPAPDARERNPVVPEAFSRILLQLMAKDPDARIQNAAELGTRLAACADELLTASESPA